MKNLHQHVESVVKDQLAKACSLLGIDKSEVGYTVGGDGGLAVIVTAQGQDLGPAWQVTLTLRHKLLGREPLAGGLPVPGVMPSDDMFRFTTDRIMAELNGVREDEFNGRPVGDGKIDPEQVRVIGKGELA